MNTSQVLENIEKAIAFQGGSREVLFRQGGFGVVGSGFPRDLALRRILSQFSK